MIVKEEFLNKLRQFFGLSSLGYNYWAVAIGLSMLMFLVVEIFKVAYKRNLRGVLNK